MAINASVANTEIFSQIGLNGSPFPVTPDATRYFCPERLESHVMELMHCIHMRKGFLLFTADVGLGKSTLSRYLINNLEEYKTHFSLVLNTFLQGVELLKAINEDFGLEVNGGIKEQLDALNAFLLEQYEQGFNCLIIIDDAQNLTAESLEMIRLISNFEVTTHKLVQILLIAQPEISDTLDLPQIRQLKSRIALHIELSPFSVEEVRDYVHFRLNSVGNAHDLSLTKEAVTCLHLVTKGYPRRINLIMDRALYALMVNPEPLITKRLIVIANNDLEQAHNSTIGVLQQKQKSQNRRWNFVAAILFLLVAVPIASWQFGPSQWRDIAINQISLIEDAYATSSQPQVINDSETQSQPIAKPLVVGVEKIDVVAEIPIKSVDNTEVIAQAPVEVVEEIKVVEVLQKIQSQNKVLFEFLQSYSVDHFYTQLEVYIAAHDWLAANKVLTGTGWTLLVNDEPFADTKSSVLNVSSENGKVYWLMLWKPLFAFETFHFGQKSEKVALLQKFLKQEGFFNSLEDATIGSKTMYALANFQRKFGLEPTGQADALTLYFLTKDKQI